jgi:hypothetical protein
MIYEVEVKVRNGFPCTVKFSAGVNPPEPDVGIFSSVEYEGIYTMKGEPAEWLDLDDHDWFLINDAIDDYCLQWGIT